jgi:hypothetical protein
MKKKAVGVTRYSDRETRMNEEIRNIGMTKKK